jgi:hypothetical protein
MNEYKERLKDLSEIRSMMERSTKVLSLSGLSGISAGLIALLGAGFAWYQLGGNWDYVGNIQPRFDINFRTFLLLDAGIVLVLALLSAALFSWRNARKMNLPIWNKTARHLLVDMGVPLVTGGLFSLIQLLYNEHHWVAATMLLFYGISLLSASRYTVREIRYLGVSQIVLGLICAAVNQYHLYFWAVGFGLFHILYGFLMYLKYER